MTDIAQEIVDDLAQTMCGSSDFSEWPGFRDDARSILATIERAGYALIHKSQIPAAIARLWPNSLGPKNLDELVIFIEQERAC